MEETKKHKILEKYKKKLKEKGVEIGSENNPELDPSKDPSKDPYSLWNNPMVNDIGKNMSESDKLKYKMEGEYMYNSIDFVDPEKDKLQDLIAYLSEVVKSGLHPSYLSEEDKQLFDSVYGKEWYAQFGYQKEDLTSITL